MSVDPHPFDDVFADLFAPVRTDQLQLVPRQIQRDAADDKRDKSLCPRDAGE